MEINLEILQQRIAQNIHRFDICALLKLLKALGYPTEEIYFESSGTLSSHTSLCQKITFSLEVPRVKITLHLGLLSANSPLPYFFRKKMDSGSISAALFTKFLSFFDHHILRNLLMMSIPEVHTLFFKDWRETKGYYLKLLDLNSTSTLWHLLQTCFPELSVKILKSPKVFKQNSSSTILGNTRLGKEAFLGKKLVQTIPSFKFILIGEHTHTSLNIPWPFEIKQRFRKIIYSFLNRTDIHFRLIFVLKNTHEKARLSSQMCLGYSTLGKGKEDLKLLLFSGYPHNLKDLY